MEWNNFERKYIQKYSVSWDKYQVGFTCMQWLQITSQRRTHVSPRRFLYLRETKSWWCGEEGEEEGENFHLLTHATARGVGKIRPSLSSDIIQLKHMGHCLHNGENVQ